MNIRFSPEKPEDSIPIGRRALDAGERKPKVSLGPALQCGFCYSTEQGKHGEVKREWFEDWKFHVPVCRKHSSANALPLDPDEI